MLAMILGFLAGVLFAFRFKVLAVVPLALATAAFACLERILEGAPSSQVWIASVLGIFVPQVGYLCGIAFRHGLAMQRVPDEAPRRAATTASFQKSILKH